MTLTLSMWAWILYLNPPLEYPGHVDIRFHAQFTTLYCHNVMKMCSYLTWHIPCKNAVPWCDDQMQNKISILASRITAPTTKQRIDLNHEIIPSVLSNFFSKWSIIKWTKVCCGHNTLEYDKSIIIIWSTFMQTCSNLL